MSDFAIGVLALGVAYLVGIVPFAIEIRDIKAKCSNGCLTPLEAVSEIKLRMFLWATLPGLYPLAYAICWVHDMVSEALIGYMEEDNEG